MSLEEIQKNAINRYKDNLGFLEKTDKELFDKIKLYEEALEKGMVEENYSLEYKDNYFDIYDIKNEIFYYNTNSINYSKSVVKTINFESNKSSFKTFYDYSFDKDVIKRAKKASILSNSLFTNSLLTDYIEKNLVKEEMKTIYKFIVFGTGLGLHIPILDEKIKAKLYLIVEPSLEIFRLSLFVTNYKKIFENKKVFFEISSSKEKFKKTINDLSDLTFVYDHYIKFFDFSKNCNYYIKVIQDFLLTQPHLIYSYSKTLMSLKRTYKYIEDRYNYINISEVLKDSILKNMPVLILAAGPSLEKEIEFVKENKDNFIIVAIYATLPLLEKYNIIPDIVTQYDQQDEIVMSTLKNMKSLDWLNDTIFLFSSHLDEKLIHQFSKENIYIFQALLMAKKRFGILTAPSIGELSYGLSLILGGEKIYLLGLDMALSIKGESHIDKHAGGSAFNNMKEASLENYSFRKSKIKVKGNFRKEVETLPVFELSINHFNKFTKMFRTKNLSIYNLSDGAYFEDTEPLLVDEIKNKFSVINKKELNEKLKKLLNDLSSKEFDLDDKSSIELELKDTKDLMRELNIFYLKKKYENSYIYKEKLFNLLDILLYKEVSCVDLQRILKYYFRDNLHHILGKPNIYMRTKVPEHIY